MLTEIPLLVAKSAVEKRNLHKYSILYLESNMATVATQQLTITISKLVKNSDPTSFAITDEQLATLLSVLPSLVEELVNDDKLIVEVDVDESLQSA